MAAAPTLPLSVDEYLDSGLDSEFEYVEGVLVPRGGGSPVHAFMIAALSGLLDAYQHTITVYVALTLNVSPERYRVPDVCFYAISDKPDFEREPSIPPRAIFEILSPSDPLDRILDKCSEYRELGVEFIFIVDPKRRKIYAPQRGGLPALETEVIRIDVGSTVIEIRASDLFRRLDQI